MEKLCLFSSHYSLGRSILTLEDDKEIKPDYPASIIAIAKNHKLDDIYLVENNLTGFIQAYQNTLKNNIHLKFGLKICVCENNSDKSEESLLTESNVIIWVLNTQGYKDVLKIYNNAATEGFYYIPRTDWGKIKELLTENLSLTIPFYSSFIARNTLNFKHRAIPDFGDFKPIFHIENHELPFDDLLENKVILSNYKTQKTNTCYYYKNSDVVPYQVFRCINNRSKFEKPNLSHFSSDQFSFETYLKNV